MTTTLSDIAVVVYFCGNGNFIHMTPMGTQPSWIATWGIVASIIPFWFRFWQCVNKYVLENNKPQVFNAMKYMSKIIPPVLAIWFEKSVGGHGFTVYFIFNLIATLYCMVWDFYMDWGLFRSKNP